jgi:hypothetical protein
MDCKSVHIMIDKDVYNYFEGRCVRYGDRSRYYRAGMREFMVKLKSLDMKTGDLSADIVDSTNHITNRITEK